MKKTATRLWTIKETAEKALELHPFQAIQEVEVVRLGEEDDGVMRYQEETCPVRHTEGDEHVITLITFDDL